MSEFGMFSKQGNVVARKIGELAKAADLDWPTTYELIQHISKAKFEAFGEISDTAVRDSIYWKYFMTKTERKRVLEDI